MLRHATLIGVLLSAIVHDARAGWARRYEVSGLASTRSIMALPGEQAAITTDNAILIIDRDGAVVRSARFTRGIHFSAAAPGGFFVGAASSGTPGVSAPWIQITKLDASLTRQWTREYIGPAGVFVVFAAAGMPDGGVVLAGESEQKAVAMRIGSDGTLRWSTMLNPSDNERLYGVMVARDGGVLLAGRSRRMPWLVKLGGNGEVQWQKSYAVHGIFRGIAETPKGELALIGESERHPVVVKTDAQGKLLWARSLDAAEGFTLHAVAAAGANITVVATGVVNESSVDALTQFTSDGAVASHWLVRPMGYSVVNRGVATNVLALSGSRVFYAPLLSAHDRTKTPEAVIVFELSALSKDFCSWFRQEPLRVDELPLAVETYVVHTAKLALDERALSATVQPANVTATPYVCPPAVLVTNNTPAAPASGFRGEVEDDQREKGYIALFLQKDFASLDAAADRYRRERTFINPMWWEGFRLYGALLKAPLEEKQRLAMLREWLQSRPQSVAARLALADALQDAAWKRRGGGYADTVTKEAWEEFNKFNTEAQRLLEQGPASLQEDPQYWQLLISLHPHTDADVRQLARRAAKLYHDPNLFRRAAFFLQPQWGGSPAEYRAFTEEAGALTKETWGDAIYAWLAYQANFSKPPGTEFKDYGFDVKRVQRGLEDIVRRNPGWWSSHHRLAWFANLVQDRPLAREVFQRPQLAWYEGAERMWQARNRYEAARDWALRVPAEAFIEKAAPPAQATAPVPATQLRKPTAAAPSSSDKLLTTAPAQWPQILMENELVLAGRTVRKFASFFVQTPSGIVAVSVVPDIPGRTDDVSPIKEARRKMASWTMWAPREPKRVLRVASIDTDNVHNPQVAVAFTLAGVTGDLPAYPLKMNPSPREASKSRTFYIVGCRWTAERCEQVVIEGKYAGGSLSSDHSYEAINIGLAEKIDPETMSGAAVLDEDGYAICVGRLWPYGGGSPEYAQTVACEHLKSVIAP